MLDGCVVHTTRAEHAGELLPCDVKMETSGTHTGAPQNCSRHGGRMSRFGDVGRPS
jgi:hypothetical protein